MIMRRFVSTTTASFVYSHLTDTIVKRGKKILSLLTLITVLVLAGLIYFKFFFVYSEGNKTGELNNFALKGFVFKTYEGTLIQAGIRGGQTSGALVESNSLYFSVKNPEIAKALLESGGMVVTLHYKHYKGVLPWRGKTTYIVDKISSVKESESAAEIANPLGEYAK